MRLKKLSEREFTDQVIQLAQLRGWRVAHFRPARTATGWRTPVQGDGKGFPDLLMIRRGQILIAELKAEKGKLTPEQQKWLRDFEESVAIVFLWTPADWPAIEKVLE